MSSSVTISGCSTLARCAASTTASRAPAIPATSRSACGSGKAGSMAPATTSAGAVMRGRSRSRSSVATASQQAAYPSAGVPATIARAHARSEEHTSELQSQSNLVCRLLLEKKKNTTKPHNTGYYVIRHTSDCSQSGPTADDQLSVLALGGASAVVHGLGHENRDHPSAHI